MGTVDGLPENVMPDRRQSRYGRSWGGRDEIFMRKIIILLLLMNGHDALLAWRKEGCGICGGRVGRDGMAIGMEGKGGGRGGTRRRMEGQGRGRRRKKRE